MAATIATGETLASSEAAGAHDVAVEAVSETVQMAEASTARMAVVCPEVEAFVLDEVNAAHVANREALSEAVAYAEAAGVHTAAGAVLFEDLSAVESTASRFAAYAAVNDTLAESEAVLVQGQSGNTPVAVSETWPSSEAASARSAYRYAASEAVPLAEATAVAYAARAGLDELVSLHDRVGAQCGVDFALDEALVVDDAVAALATYRVAQAEALQWWETTNMSSGTVTPIPISQPAHCLLLHFATDGAGAAPVQVPATRLLHDFGLRGGALANMLARAAMDAAAWPALGTNPRVQLSFVPVVGDFAKFPAASTPASVRFVHDPVAGNVLEFDAPNGVVDVGIRISYVHSIVAG